MSSKRNAYWPSTVTNMYPTTRDWESVFATWAQSPSKTEQDRCEHAERAIRAAIDANDKLNCRDIKVFAHGSLRNNVNIRQESDVDVGILCRDTFFFDLPIGYTREQFGLNTPATYHYAQFKTDVEEALVNHFGRAAVLRGNKAFDIRPTSYRVDADVAPFFEYRWYQASGLPYEGVKLLPDNGGIVINWPEQHNENGVARNTATGRAFKGVVRILKRLCAEMDDAGVGAACACPGFLIECMAYNAPDTCFAQQTWRQAVREVLAFLFNNTLADEKCAKWTEVSAMKWLFDPAQKWNRIQAHSFLDAAWDYVGLE